MSISGTRNTLYICILVFKIWYNVYMDEKRILKVLEKPTETESEVHETPEKPKFSHMNQTNPIYKHLGKFINAKIGDKLSIKDLLK